MGGDARAFPPRNSNIRKIRARKSPRLKKTKRSERAGKSCRPTENKKMRHRVAGFKLGRNTSHRRALLRNLVTSLVMEERIETTVIKAKAMRPLAEKMVTLGKRGDQHARKQAAAYLQTTEAVKRLFDTVAPRFGSREGGYTRIVRTGFRKGDGGESAIIEFLGSEKFVAKKREKSAEARAKRSDEMKKQMEADNAALEREAGGKEEK